MSRSEAYLGCLLCADPKKGEYFCQIVGPGEVTERKILGSAFAIGKDAAREAAMSVAGVDRLSLTIHWPAISDLKGKPVGRLHMVDYDRGLLAVMKECEQEIEKLCHVLR